MKVGIVTLPLHINFGGYLQNYALQQVLLDIGHSPITLNQRPKPRTYKAIFESTYIPNLKTFVLKSLGKGENRDYFYEEDKKIRPLLWEHMLCFYDKYISHTGPLNPNKDFKRICDRLSLDAVIVGSDQVWRPKYVEKLDVSYLSFAKTKKIAYAPSFGTDQWEYSIKETENAKSLISQFNAVSVRESSGVKMCRNHFGIDAALVLDPTLLLDKDRYIKLVEQEKQPKSDGDLFCYVLDDNPQIRKIISAVALSQKLRQFSVNIGESTQKYSSKYVRQHVDQFKNPSVTEWLRGFMDAKMVIADSFHAVAFSIIFNKPFWVVGNKVRGLARFKSILEMFGLEDRLIDVSSTFDSVDWDKPIDWNRVNSVCDDWRRSSIVFLKQSLEK